MARIIGNDIFLATGQETVVKVWFAGVEDGLNVVGPTMPAHGTALRYGHTGFRRWYDIDTDGTGYTNYEFAVACEGDRDYTLFKVVVGGLT